jgi:hypothetical protein
MNIRLFLLVGLGMLACLSGLVAQTTKTIHQTFNLDGAQKVTINFVGKSIEVRETKGSRVLVEVSVKLGLPNDRLLDFVINQGRYNLEVSRNTATGELIITSKKSNNVLIMKGQECPEELAYIVYVPAAIKFVNNSTVENSSRE